MGQFPISVFSGSRPLEPCDLRGDGSGREFVVSSPEDKYDAQDRSPRSGTTFVPQTMATCIYCGKKAGFFSKYHETCFAEAEKNRNLGAKVIGALIEVALKDKQAASALDSRLSKTVSQYKLSSECVGQTVLTKVDELSREEPLDTAAAEYLLQLIEKTLGKADKIPPGSPFYPSYDMTLLNLSLSRNLWLIMQGKKVVALPTPCDVVLQPGENRLAEFGTVLYRKSVMVSSHIGGYNGVGVRVASGLYYRFGGFAGRTVSSPEVQNVDYGFWVLTNKGMYFAGQQTTFRIPYNSILRFKAYPDGLGFFRSVGAGREELFTILNGVLSSAPDHFVPLHVGWFLYNLATFLTTPNQAT